MLFVLSFIVLVLLLLLIVHRWNSVGWLRGLGLLAGGMAIMAAWYANRAFYRSHDITSGVLWTIMCVAYLFDGGGCIIRHNGLVEKREP